MTRSRAVVRNILLAFVLVTVGFALGKAAARRERGATVQPERGDAATNAAATARESVPRVQVVYAHTTVRCVTCNTIERLGERVIRGRYSKELADGRVDWRVVDFQQDESFAKRYEVVSSCLVLVATKDAKEVAHRRLDEVWTHVRNPAAFENYVVEALDAMLGKGGAKE